LKQCDATIIQQQTQKLRLSQSTAKVILKEHGTHAFHPTRSVVSSKKLRRGTSYPSVADVNEIRGRIGLAHKIQPGLSEEALCWQNPF
jgi:hypothetical protein